MFTSNRALLCASRPIPATAHVVAAVVSLFSHGPESTGLLDNKKISFAPSVSGGGGGLSLWGRF